MHGGGALNASATFAEIHTAADVGPSWFSVFAPSWISEAFVSGMALITIASLPASSVNGRLMQANTVAQSILCAVFQLLLAVRLHSESGSWFLVFLPWYLSVGAQTFLHYQKATDTRGRRPGFPVGVPHILALVVSFKLLGIFSYSNTSWANVLWPLWGTAGFFLISLSCGLCCGLPLVMRREAQVRCHLISMFGAILLLLCAIVLPALLAAVRLTLWLDGDCCIRARDILLPYLIAVSVILLLLCVSLVLVSFSSAVRARNLTEGGMGDGDEEGSIAELFSALPPPSALVRESSTLFRRVSSTTLDKIEGLSGHGNSAGFGGAAGSMARDAPSDRLLPPDAATSSHASSHSGSDRSDSEDASTAIELTQLRVEDACTAPGTAEGVGGSAWGTGGVTSAPCAGNEDGSDRGSACCLSAASHALPGSAEGQGEGSSSSTNAATLSEARVAEADSDDDGLGGDLCWICCQGEREAVLLECGHGGICFSCAERCARKRPPLCPMCRQRISSIVRIAGPGKVVNGEVVVECSANFDKRQPPPAPSLEPER